MGVGKKSKVLGKEKGNEIFLRGNIIQHIIISMEFVGFL